MNNKVKMTVSLAMLTMLGLAACGGGEEEGSSSGDVENELVLGFYGGVIGQAFQDTFVEQCSDSLGVSVLYEEDFDAPRMTKMQAGSADIDVAVFTDPIMPDLRSADLIADLPVDSIPNYEDVPEDFKTADSVAISLAVWGITYDNAQVQQVPTSWADLLDEAYAGSVTAPSITYNSSYLTLAAFQQMAGGDMTTNLDPGFALMQQLRDNSPSFWASSSDMLQQMQSGAILMSPYASGSTAEAAAQPGGENIAFVAPEEGAYPVAFNMTIAKGAESPNAAAAFINCVLEPDNQAAWVEKYPSFPANSQAEVPESARKWLGGVEKVADLTTVNWDDIAEHRDEITAKWQREIG